ncbi:hypothetical protein Q1695_004238 [Nippostrongylus brasiliensis]|nr:hypothetical protein Q1695_004238 [Nippostrongylus brasiliensis]
MLRGFALLSSLIAISCASTGRLRVMTFNIWNSGSHVESGLYKVAKHILIVNPDVVALQEVQRRDVLPTLLQFLGQNWTGLACDDNYPDVAILTRHRLDEETLTTTNRSIGARIEVDTGHFISFWSAHLDYKSFGPYAANNKMVTSVDQILAGEKPLSRAGREQNMLEIQDHPQMVEWLNDSAAVPVILCGDFNSPSHIDWIEETRNEHGNWMVEWPATKIAEEMGFTDAFRELHPNVTEVPGYTWSTVNKFMSDWEFNIPEPQDRIDFVLYKGTGGSIAPIESLLYAGSEPLNAMPYHRKNDYPSDHYALVVDFDFLYPPSCRTCN